MENLVHPLVSILMTVYNREKYIAEAIESVINSSYQNWELIIVDDQSKDRSLEIARSYEAKDSRIRVYVNEVNLGDYPNRNKAASYAKGKYLKYLDADDTIYKYSLDYMVDAMEKYPNAAMALSYNKIDDLEPYPQISYPNQTYYAEYIKKSILGCGPSASIIKRDVFLEHKGFSGKRYIGDHELWLKISASHPIIKIQPSLVWWRQHEDQQIVSERKDYNVANERYQLSIYNLRANKNFFSANEYLFAERKVKQNYARYILLLLIKKRQYNAAFQLFKLSNLSLIEILRGFKGYL